MPRRTRVALVTGGTKGIGYYIGKEIVKRIPSAVCYMTSRDSVSGFSTILGMELGAGARDRSKFIQLDIRDEEMIGKHRDKIVKSFGGLDILVNNAGIYQKPTPEDDKFPLQVKEILSTNYWGTKNVITAFYNDFKPNSRIVNITSNLAHVKSVVEPDQAKLKGIARERFANARNLCELDGLVMKFQRDANLGIWEREGWPTCAYSVSKMAINAFTRILQHDFDEANREDVVVNAVYPGTHHSKIDQSNVTLVQDEDGARFVFYMATVMPNSQGIFPRGAVIWDNTKVVYQDNELVLNNKLSEVHD